jgi:diguanylate cyclase (GGDEF)-like protein
MRGPELPEMRSLTNRIVELERERADAREQAQTLVALQGAFTMIAVARTSDDVIAHVLRAARDPLGFDRAIYFDVDRNRGIEARAQVDGSDVVEPSTERIDVRAGSAALSILRNGDTDGIGRARDLCAPLVDVRWWYGLSALTNSEGAIGLLYVDGHRGREPRDWEFGLVRALTTIASVAIDNSILLAKTQELAMRDPLTGLFNRRAFAERLMSEIAASEAGARSFTYVMIDIDDFKRINDSHGHAHGDAVLRKLGETLTRSSRADDVVARYAGDEFVVLLTNVDDDQARTLVARLSNDLRASGLSCSLGAASFPRDASDAGSLLAAADRALYTTKAAGKNGYAFV